MLDLLTVPNLLALLTLSGLEIVLGVDNIIVLAILTAHLPAEQRRRLRRMGLALAMIQRLLLLLAINWIAQLKEPLLTLPGRAFSGRDLVLAGGGAFLIIKGAKEIRELVSARSAHQKQGNPAARRAKMPMVVAQILFFDAVFSLDSIITAIGMANEVWVMMAAVIVAVLVMMLSADAIGEFILKMPTLKMLALAFLVLIGAVLVADGLGYHFDRGSLYFAMAFAVIVEAFNLRVRSRHPPAG